MLGNNEPLAEKISKPEIANTEGAPQHAPFLLPMRQGEFVFVPAPPQNFNRLNFRHKACRRNRRQAFALSLSCLKSVIAIPHSVRIPFKHSIFAAPGVVNLCPPPPTALCCYLIPLLFFPEVLEIRFPNVYNICFARLAIWERDSAANLRQIDVVADAD